MSEQKWISVEHDIPEFDTPVWLWNGKSCWIGLRAYVMGEGWFWCDVGKPWWDANKKSWSCDVADMDDYKVTHWARLITPPTA
jgi:hypothetical protein